VFFHYRCQAEHAKAWYFHLAATRTRHHFIETFTFGYKHIPDDRHLILSSMKVCHYLKKPRYG